MRKGSAMTVQFEIEKKPGFSFHYQELAKKLIPHILKEEGFPLDAQVSILFVDDDAIHALNLQTREVDSATDVLSFPMVDYDTPADYSILLENPELYKDPDTDEVMLGDIVLSVDHIYAQAEEYGHSVRREYAFLITHSMLHLLGYDHMTEDEREQMEEKQRTILDALSISRDD